jgi:ferredoxin/flavodoxin
MRTLICYWSLTGATRRVAESIAEGVRPQGADVSLADIRNGVPASARDFDLVGIGFPVHWYRAPTPVVRAVHSLGRLDGLPAFVFCTFGTFRSTALDSVRRMVARQGATEIGVFASQGEGHFYPYARRGHQFSTGHPTAADLEAARRFGEGVAEAARRCALGEPSPPPAPRDPRGHPLLGVIRMASSQAMTDLLYARFFHADPARCARCGRCARACPVRNIAWHKGELPVWDRSCVLCLECVRVCPEEAVVCPIDWPIFSPFIRWTIGRALRIPGLEHTRVEFCRGRIVRMPEP